MVSVVVWGTKTPEDFMTFFVRGALTSETTLFSSPLTVRSNFGDYPFFALHPAEQLETDSSCEPRRQHFRGKTYLCFEENISGKYAAVNLSH